MTCLVVFCSAWFVEPARADSTVVLETYNDDSAVEFDLLLVDAGTLIASWQRPTRNIAVVQIDVSTMTIVDRVEIEARGSVPMRLFPYEDEALLFLPGGIVPPGKDPKGSWGEAATARLSSEETRQTPLQIHMKYRWFSDQLSLSLTSEGGCLVVFRYGRHISNGYGTLRRAALDEHWAIQEHTYERTDGSQVLPAGALECESPLVDDPYARPYPFAMPGRAPYSAQRCHERDGVVCCIEPQTASAGSPPTLELTCDDAGSTAEPSDSLRPSLLSGLASTVVVEPPREVGPPTEEVAPAERPSREICFEDPHALLRPINSERCIEALELPDDLELRSTVQVETRNATIYELMRSDNASPWQLQATLDLRIADREHDAQVQALLAALWSHLGCAPSTEQEDASVPAICHMVDDGDYGVESWRDNRPRGFIDARELEGDSVELKVESDCTGLVVRFEKVRGQWRVDAIGETSASCPGC